LVAVVGLVQVHEITRPKLAVLAAAAHRLLLPAWLHLHWALLKVS
jgi:hypothetical protein